MTEALEGITTRYDCLLEVEAEEIALATSKAQTAAAALRGLLEASEERREEIRATLARGAQRASQELEALKAAEEGEAESVSVENLQEGDDWLAESWLNDL